MALPVAPSANNAVARVISGNLFGCRRLMDIVRAAESAGEFESQRVIR